MLPHARSAFALSLLSCGLVSAASLSIAVKDPSGSFVAGASVTVEGKSPAESRQTATDAWGHAQFDSIPAGSCHVTVLKDGFERWEQTVSIGDKPADLAVALKLKVVTTTVQVSARRSPLANSDPNYNSLRGGKLTKVYRVQDLALKRDVGTFTFRSGSFSFLPPVLGAVTTGVFVGDGDFQMKPAFDLAVKHLHRMAGVDSVDENFTAMVVYFSDSTFEEIKQHSELADEAPQPHEEAFKRVKEVLEHRREPSQMHRLTLLERLLNYEDIPNYDAEILAELYNGQRGSFRAFVHGKKHSDLRFLLNPRGAMAMLPAPEEVALLNFDPNSETDGVWYLSHLAGELQSAQANSNEDKRLVAPEHYTIEALIGRANLIGNIPDLAVTCDLRFHSLENGVRMVKFDLAPDLQVSHVKWSGKEIPFIQESRKQDGSFYLQMPEALEKGHTYEVNFEYAGGEILQTAFGGIPPRRVWYPAPAGAANRATYDLTFRIPRGTTIVTTGDPAGQSRDGSYDVSRWVSEVPITQAVFRYLEDPAYKSSIEETTNTRMSAYVSTGGRGFLPPSTGDILIDTGNSLRVFNAWFGKPAYDSISVVVGPAYDSLPGLVYAPPVLLAGYSSVVSQSLVMSRGRGRTPPATIRPFLDEAFPQQVAQQWWGNTVRPVSFHDSWLAAGFANFSTSLYDLAAYLKPDQFRDHWVTARNALLQPNRFGVKPNDAGPVWMGMLNDTFKTAGAGNILATSKGGYILHMLRSMMWDPKTGDEDFRAMMQDYVKQFANQSVSTENFEMLVAQHMKPAMDLQRNHRMDWFFGEWLFGTDVPSYHLEYSLVPDKDGKVLLTVKLSQSGVSAGFAMPVPIFADFAGKKVRVAVAAMIGNSTADFKVRLPEAPKHVLLNINHDVLTDREEVKQIK